LVYFMVIWYIFTVLVCCTKKNLAALAPCKYVGHFRCRYAALVLHFECLCLFFEDRNAQIF
jgi:hypothetical protein